MVGTTRRLLALVYESFDHRTHGDPPEINPPRSVNPAIPWRASFDPHCILAAESNFFNWGQHHERLSNVAIDRPAVNISFTKLFRAPFYYVFGGDRPIRWRTPFLEKGCLGDARLSLTFHKEIVQFLSYCLPSI